MGLDMYLRAKQYISGYDHNLNKQQFYDVLKAAGVSSQHSKRCRTPSGYLSFHVAYWRKANQIHNWFVNHVQDGKDDCGEYYVEREKLQELVNTCKEVLQSLETVEGDVHDGTTYYPDGRVVENTHKGKVVAQKGLAQSKLPTASGFFFGSTDYDEYYLEDLQDTVDMIQPILDDPQLKDWNLEYHSSW